jgi:hypothetical protein
MPEHGINGGIGIFSHDPGGRVTPRKDAKHLVGETLAH